MLFGGILYCNKPVFIIPSGPSVVYLAKLEAKVGIIHLWVCSILLPGLSVTPAPRSHLTLFLSLCFSQDISAPQMELSPSASYQLPYCCTSCTSSRTFLD